MQTMNFRCSAISLQKVASLFGRFNLLWVLFIAVILTGCGNRTDEQEVQSEQEVATSNTYDTYYLSDNELAKLVKEAENGDVLAANRVALFYIYIEADDEKSLKWLKMASELGDPEAIWYLGMYYVHRNELSNCLSVLSMMKKANLQAGTEDERLYIKERTEDLKLQCSQIIEPAKKG